MNWGVDTDPLVVLHANRNRNCDDSIKIYEEKFISYS